MRAAMTPKKHVYIERDPTDGARYVVRYFQGARAFDVSFASLGNARKFAREKATPHGVVVDYI